jgi:CBS domain-containing protein
LAFQECSECSHFAGVFLPQNQGGSFVVCTGCAPAEPPTGAPPRAPAGDSTPISTLMSQSVVCAREDMEISELVAMLLERDVSGVPVVDDQWRVVGVVSRTDIFRFDHASDYKGAAPFDSILGCTVREIMTPQVFSLPEDAAISTAVALMVYEGIHRLPIVSSEGMITGIVTTLDVMRWMAHQSGYAISRAARPGRSTVIE